jgi:hypothetical protein
MNLHEEMDRMIPHHLYPAGVIPVPDDRIKGTAFFPGGLGLYLENRKAGEIEFPFGGLLFLFTSRRNPYSHPRNLYSEFIGTPHSHRPEFAVYRWTTEPKGSVWVYKRVGDSSRCH